MIGIPPFEKGSFQSSGMVLSYCFTNTQSKIMDILGVVYYGLPYNHQGIILVKISLTAHSFKVCFVSDVFLFLGNICVCSHCVATLPAARSLRRGHGAIGHESGT